MFQGLHGHRHGQISFASSGRAHAKHQIVIGNRRDITGLAGGTRADQATAELQFDRRIFGRQRFAGHAGENVRNFLGRNHSVATCQLLELLEDLRGLRHGLILAFDMNPFVTTRDRDAQRIADFAKVLIAGSEQSQKRL